MSYLTVTKLRADQYLVDWLDHLKRRQNERSGNRNSPYLNLERKTVEMIFNICEELKQPPDSRFLSVELYSRYHSNHVKDAMKAATRTSNPKKVWGSAKNQINELSLLRVISCIQLASKFTMHSKIVLARSAEKILLKCNQYHSRGNILLSESRVFKSLDYKVGEPTLLAYLDVLIHLCLPRIEKRLYDTCVRIMDVIYIRNQDISKEIAHRIIRCPLKDYIVAYNGCDSLLMSSAILMTAISICYPGNGILVEFVKNQLSKYTSKTKEQISVLYSVTTQIVIAK